MSSFVPGQRIHHAEFGSGVVLESLGGDRWKAFFSQGERQVHSSTLAAQLTWEERLLSRVEGGAERAERLRLALEAIQLPLTEDAAALTSARVDLLPHQVVLTHQVAEASPRRFLIADEVGLGKTIETALILRELASRGELKRALMVVPAGLVHNWQRELNEVFGLDFEVFGSEGDVTDRRSNAFEKHHRLIASIDTLKRPARLKRILDAPTWDLVVFDEAHHLTAARQGNRVRKTENYKFAEALRGHTRDLLLLSATPHQGDHFTFWMLLQLLKPTLFRDVEDMLQNRHRLNEIVVRRTKADACTPDGSPLFARRWVNTEAFTMSAPETDFYSRLREYLEQGFALAKRGGGPASSIGLVMSVFQKIAASSFAAVGRTLHRRLLLLTLHETLQCDEDMDLDGRDRLDEEARELLRQMRPVSDDLMGRHEIDRELADWKLKLARQLQKEEARALESDSELHAGAAEEEAIVQVRFALPEERAQIRDLLQSFPSGNETKVEKLMHALGVLWQQNSNEKVVVFATYLGTVDLIEREILRRYPGQGVAVLRGGDHAAKTAAEKRFKRADGPRVLVCTAAGREGINLQFARVLFNFDLPWNPMDLEQRIGRIHRYGQKDTAQVYNLVLADTLEGRIFLLLEEKLSEIARTLGKVDEQGNVAEDLRSQILGQLSEKLSYDRLYQEALGDPDLKRTRLEVDIALSNASKAREVVFELFQDLQGFRLEDYEAFSDVTASLSRLRAFLSVAGRWQGACLEDCGPNIYRWSDGKISRMLTTDRDLARQREELELIGLDHPLVTSQFERWSALPPEERGIAVSPGVECAGVASWWKVEVQDGQGGTRTLLLLVACDGAGQRRPAWEAVANSWLQATPAASFLDPVSRRAMQSTFLEPMVRRELINRGLLSDAHGLASQLVGWLELSPQAPS